MKVLLITPSPPEYLGGLALFSKDLALNLEKCNIQVDMLTSTLSKEGPILGKIGENINVLKQKVYFFPDNENMFRIKNPLFFILKHLRKNGFNYDLIHVHSYIYFSTIQTFIYKYFFNRNVPIVLHLHGGIQTKEYKASTRTEKMMLILKRYIFDILSGKFIIRKSEALISVSKDDILEVNKVFKVKRRKNNYYLPNVVDSNKFIKLKNIDKKYIGFIGRLTKIKGIDLFLELVEKINKTDKGQKFLIIGEGPYIDDVKKAVKKYPIEFIKNVVHDKIITYYNQCSIFIQTSRAEGLSTCILEALSCEVPVVASDVGGTNEVILNGKTGYLFNNGEIDQAIEFIKKIKDNESFDELGKNGREIIVKNFSWDVITRKIITIYKKLLNGKN